MGGGKNMKDKKFLALATLIFVGLLLVVFRGGGLTAPAPNLERQKLKIREVGGVLERNFEWRLP